MQANLEKIMKLAEAAAQPLALAVVDVRIGQQGRRRSLEVTIYRPGGHVGLSDCEQVSRALDELLETQNPPLIDAACLLDVQSPGIDRMLTSDREFKLFSGQQVEVKTKQKVDELGADHLVGKLNGLADGRILLLSHPEKKAAAPQSHRQRSAWKTAGRCTASPLPSPPESLAIELANVIHVRLLPDEFKTE